MTLETRLAHLHNTMERMSSDDMGELSFAEAAMFHAATDLIERILDSRYEVSLD